MPREVEVVWSQLREARKKGPVERGRRGEDGGEGEKPWDTNITLVGLLDPSRGVDGVPGIELV